MVEIGEILKLKRIFALVFIIALFVVSIVVLSAPNVKAQDNTSDARVLSYSFYVAPSDTSLAYQAGDLVVSGRSTEQWDQATYQRHD